MILKEYFDNKYKIILHREYNPTDYLEMIDWINEISNGNVLIKVFDAKFSNDEWITSIGPSSETVVFIGFENIDDALLFKLKYKV